MTGNLTFFDVVSLRARASKPNKPGWIEFYAEGEGAQKLRSSSHLIS